MNLETGQTARNSLSVCPAQVPNMWSYTYDVSPMKRLRGQGNVALRADSLEVRTRCQAGIIGHDCGAFGTGGEQVVEVAHRVGVVR